MLRSVSLVMVSLLVWACGGNDGDESSPSGGSSGGGSAGTAGAAGGGTGGTAGGSTGGSGGSGGGITPGDVIDAPNETWTWVPFADSACGNGSPTGIAISKTSRSDKLLLFLNGGGACWDQLTCDTLNLASYINTGFGEADATQSFGTLGGTGIFNRDNPDNPFADYSFVFVPYCTGDVHAGDNPNAPDGKAHVGYLNVGAFLNRVVPTFAKASQVVLSGASAGGFGVLMNYDRVARAFGSSVPVVLLDDSGPPMAPQYLTESLQTSTLVTAWNSLVHLPEGCPDVGVGKMENVYECLSTLYPDGRFGLLVSEQDQVIRSFYGYGLQQFPMNAAAFQEGLYDVASRLEKLDRWRYYFIAGDKHTWVGDEPVGGTTVSGVKITDWMRGLRDGSTDWSNVSP